MDYQKILKLSKDELVCALKENGVSMEEDASINQLRAALRKVSVVDGASALEEYDEDGKVQETKELTVDEIDHEILRLKKLQELYEMRRTLANAKCAVEEAESRAESVVNKSSTLSVGDLTKNKTDFAEDGKAIVKPHRYNDRLSRVAEFEILVNKFSGDDHVNVRRWVADFEEAAETFQLDDESRWFFAKRLLSGSAKTYFCDNKLMTWKDFRNQIIEIFDRQLSRNDICKQLERRVILKNETPLQYFIVMRDIANQSDLEERDIVRYIVKGLNDNSGNAANLYYANNLVELRRLLVFYEKIRNDGEIKPMKVVQTSSKPNNVLTPNKTGLESSETRCFNCRRKGHRSDTCKFPKRPEGACFRCWEVGHKYRDCPKRNVAVVESPMGDDLPKMENDDEEISVIESVSVAFMLKNKRCTKVKNIFCLLDTGSPVSFVKMSVVPNNLFVGSLKLSSYRGLGGVNIPCYGTVDCLIKFRVETRVIKFFIIPDSLMPTPMLLGRDALRLLHIKLICSISKPVPFNGDNIENELNKIDVNTVYKSWCASLFFNISSYYKGSPYVNSCNVSAGLPRSFVSAGKDCFVEWLSEWNLVGTVGEDVDCDIGDSFGPENARKCLDLLRDRYFNPARPVETPIKYTMDIKLTDDKPFSYSPRRLSYHERDCVAKIIEDLLASGTIRPSNSPFASPIVLVPKKSGEIRMCVDYRALNKMTYRDNFPLPLIEDCLEYLEGKTCFSIVDLKSGFHQVEMAEDSIKYTSFVTPHGQYEYVKMPFGLKNGPSVFQRFITQILGNMIRSGKIIVYMDDILIATGTVGEQFEILTELFDLLVKYKLEIKLSKCKFLQSEIDYLGYKADSRGIRPNDFHIDAIRNYPLPSSLREVHSCLGLFSYFRKFVPSFSRIAAPLTDLLRKNTPFVMSPEAKKAFYDLREMLSRAPVLAIYNRERETELHTDASSHGFGAILLQKQDDGKLHPISFYSRRSTGAESRYHSFELETLAIIYALRRFRVYLEHRPFKIVTDCNSLAQTLVRKSINPRIARWALELENYNYTIVHRVGSSMGHVDALSRQTLGRLENVIADPCKQQVALDSPPLSENSSIVALVGATPDDIDLLLQVEQMRDPDICSLRSKLEVGPFEKFELINGLVYRRTSGGDTCFYVPKVLEEQLIRRCHEKLGHLATEKCYEDMKMLYWFPSMRSKIDLFIRNCLSCILYSVPKSVNKRNLHSIPKAPVPFDTIHIDHYGPLPNVNSKRRHLLVVVDAFTKFVKLYAVNTTSTREVNESLRKYFDAYSRPRRIISDRGSCFTSLEFASFLQDHNIQHIKVATASPQANGQVERVNRVLTPILGKLTEPESQSGWHKLLNRVEFALNNSVHSSTRQTPSKLLFGVSQRGPIVDELAEFLDGELVVDRVDLNSLRTEADQNIRQSQARNEEIFARQGGAPLRYNVGDFVAIRNVDVTSGTSKKFIPKYRGPYVVKRVLPNDRYEVTDVENCQLTQLPYRGILEAARLKRWMQVRDKTVAFCL